MSETDNKDISSYERYIPYGGGSLGWFENSGVMACELPNNYKFYQLLNAETVRKTLLERWGESGGENRRAARRYEVGELHIKAAISHQDEDCEARVIDFSAHGLQIQLILTKENPNIFKGSQLILRRFTKQEGGQLDININATVMWINQTGIREPIWHMGIHFDTLDIHDLPRLSEFFRV